MFGFGWSEIAVIGLVALVCIGPKDMPVAMKAVAGMVRKMRRMAAEFQTHVDEMMREADLQDVQTTIREIRGLNMRTLIDKHVDPDGAMRGAMADPFRDHPVPPVVERPIVERPPVAPIPGPSPEFLPPRPVQPAAGPPGAAPDFLPPGKVAEPKPRTDDI